MRIAQVHIDHSNVLHFILALEIQARVEPAQVVVMIHATALHAGGDAEPAVVRLILFFDLCQSDFSELVREEKVIVEFGLVAAHVEKSMTQVLNRAELLLRKLWLKIKF